MLVDVRQVDRVKIERKQMFALRLAHLLGMCEGVERFEKLSSKVQVHFLRLSYGDLIYQLLVEDHERGISYLALSNKYGISKRYAIKLIQNGKKANDEEE